MFLCSILYVIQVMFWSSEQLPFKAASTIMKPQKKKDLESGTKPTLTFHIRQLTHN